MYFFEQTLAGTIGFAREDESIDNILDKVDGAVSQTITRAIHDATHSPDAALRQEAAAWLLICCPDIAEQVELPDLHHEAMPTLAAAYVSSDSHN